MHHVDTNLVYGEKAWQQECFELYWISHGGNTPENSRCTATYHPSRKPSELDDLDMRDTAGEVRVS